MEYDLDVIEDQFTYQVCIPKVGNEPVYTSPAIPRENRKWKISIEPHDNKYLSFSANIGLNLHSTSGTRSLESRAKLTGSFINDDGEKHGTCESEIETCSPGEEVIIDMVWSPSNTTGAGTLFTRRAPDIINFFFEVVVYKPRDLSQYASLLLGTQLAVAREEGILTNFTLAVETEELKAHKFVLAARSPVFRRMIESPMIEGEEARVTIDDFTAEVVEEMLTFIYSGKAPKLKEMTKDLLAIADKYEVDGLKILCIKELDRLLTVDNAAEILLLADTHNAEQLKLSCVRFIALHFNEIKVIDLGPNVVKDRHSLYVQVLEEVASIDSSPSPAKKQRSCDFQYLSDTF